MIKIQNRKAISAGLAVLTAGMIFAGSSMGVFAATGTVSSSNVKVRAEASTSSEQVSSLDSGDTVDIVEETTDSQGYVWYKISVDGDGYGYVRSDLIAKSGGSSESTSSESTESLPETSVTAMDSQSATVTVESANVRSGAGIGYETVGTVANGDTVTVTGEANGTDSKKWYQISFGSSGKTGFVRADLVQIGAAAETTEGTDGETAAEGTEGAEGTEVAEGTEGTEAVEGAEGAEVAEGADAAGTTEADPNAATEVAVDTSVGNGEFSLAYKDDGSGTEVWYLYDNVEGTQVKLTDLLTYASAGQQTDQLKAQANKLKIVMIVMAVIIAVLVLAVLLLVYKLRDMSYYEEEEPEAPKNRKRDNYDDLPAKKTARKSFNKDLLDEPKSKGRVVADSKRSEKADRSDKSERVERTERVERAERSERTISPSRERKSAPIGTAESLLGSVNTRSEHTSQARRPVQSDSQRTAMPDEGRPVNKQQAGGRKSRNFLIDDEDFEFEFLNLDDDDK